MKIEELEKIEEALRKGEISYTEASNIIYKPTPTMSWQTAEWKKKREEIIKGYCEQCGSTEGNMVIQHLWHPPKYKKQVRDIYEEFFSREQNNPNLPVATDDDVNAFMSEYTEEVEACPSCEKRSLYKRKTMSPVYKCSKCNFEFDHPKMLPYNSTLKTVAPPIEELKKILTCEKQRQFVWDTYEDEIKTNTILKVIEDSIRYQSMKDTKTFCSRCAFLWDMKKRKVCDVCKNKNSLIELSMHACYQCQDKGHSAVLLKN